MIGKVTFIGAGPGDPELITVKGLRAIQAADVIFHDSLIDRSLLEGVRGRLMFVGKRCGMHSMSQEEINRNLVAQALKGRQVARLKGGDSAVLGRLGEELLALAEHHVPYEIIPGVTSATAAPVFAGIPVTHRGLADSFVVVTAHRRLDEEAFSIPPYCEQTTLVLMMALGTAPQWREQLLERGYPGTLPVAFVSSGGTAAQRVLVTTLERALEDLPGSGQATPTMAVVGRVVSLQARLDWFVPQPGEADYAPPAVAGAD